MTTTYSTEGEIQPRHGGPVRELNPNDVLCGRGGRIAQHPGNVFFRDLVRKHRAKYLSIDTKKKDKVKIAAKIIYTIRNLDPPGRFLKGDDSEERSDDNNSCGDSLSKATWIEIGDERAKKKAGQAMREKVDEGKRERLHKLSVKCSQQQMQMMGGILSYSAIASSLPSTTFSNTSQSTKGSSRHQAYCNLQESPILQTVLVSNHQQESYSYPPNAFEPQPIHNNMANLNRHQILSEQYAETKTTTQTNQNFTDSQQNDNSSLCLLSESNNHSFDSSAGNSVQSNPSTLDDSWDQGLTMNDFQLVDTMRKPTLARTESARRRQFQMMKDESSCLPSLNLPSSSALASSSSDDKAKEDHNFDENELMKGSLVSMDMHSSSGFSGEIAATKNKSVNMDMQSSSELKNKSNSMIETTMSMNDMRMDSLMTSLTSLIMAD